MAQWIANPIMAPPCPHNILFDIGRIIIYLGDITSTVLGIATIKNNPFIPVGTRQEIKGIYNLKNRTPKNAIPRKIMNMKFAISGSIIGFITMAIWSAQRSGLNNELPFWIILGGLGSLIGLFLGWGVDLIVWFLLKTCPKCHKWFVREEISKHSNGSIDFLSNEIHKDKIGNSKGNEIGYVDRQVQVQRTTFYGETLYRCKFCGHNWTVKYEQTY